jgi:hypothetical protein
MRVAEIASNFFAYFIRPPEGTQRAWVVNGEIEALWGAQPEFRLSFEVRQSGPVDE